MFSHDGLRGDSLPDKTLCLTYDDGPGETGPDVPGPNTTELGRFLHEHAVRATFFVVGRHVEQYPGTLPRLREWGHLIGNHTYSHPGLVRLARSGGDVLSELVKTDELIRPFVDGCKTYFRPPYGNWREKSRPDGPEDAPRSVVAEILNRSAHLAHYVGPVLWDIMAEDWECWRQFVSPEESARRHLAEIERVRRGIVLLHDSSEEDDVRPRNRTLELTKLLVPELLTRGYRFVRLDKALAQRDPKSGRADRRVGPTLAARR